MKVLIYRGDTLHAEHELGTQPLKIGRSAGNDIVLEDAGKGVSRQHAEIRPEDGGYTLVDLDSQNGIWVGGSRVPSVRLAPGVAAAVGPYRLTVPDEVAAAPIPEDAKESPVEPTEYNRPVDARVVAGVGGILDAPVAAGPVDPISPLASSPPAAPRVTGASTARPAPRDGGASTVRSPSSAKTAGGKSSLGVFAAVAVLLMAAVAFGSYELVLHKRTPKPVWSRDAAVALVNQGRCQEAMQQQIGPALAANPNEPDALALKAQCAPPPPPPQVVPNPSPASPPPDPTAQALDAVEASLANVTVKTPPERSTECQSDLDAVNAVLATSPDNVRAHDLQTKAQDCVKAATPAKPATPAVARAKSPAEGGLEVKPPETQAEYNRRCEDMRKRYDDAIVQMQAQHYLQAKKAFDDINAQVPPGYLDLAQRRSDLQKAMLDESRGQLNAAQQAEQKGDYAGALQRFQRVHDLDPSHDVGADIARVNDEKLRAGQEACKNGEANFTLGRNAEAAPLLLKATQLLPESDSCYQSAKKHLAQINGR